MPLFSINLGSELTMLIHLNSLMRISDAEHLGLIHRQLGLDLALCQEMEGLAGLFFLGGQRNVGVRGGEDGLGKGGLPWGRTCRRGGR